MGDALCIALQVKEDEVVVLYHSSSAETILNEHDSFRNGQPT